VWCSAMPTHTAPPTDPSTLFLNHSTGGKINTDLTGHLSCSISEVLGFLYEALKVNEAPAPCGLHDSAHACTCPHMLNKAGISRLFPALAEFPHQILLAYPIG